MVVVVVLGFVAALLLLRQSERELPAVSADKSRKRQISRESLNSNTEKEEQPKTEAKPVTAGSGPRWQNNRCALRGNMLLVQCDACLPPPPPLNQCCLGFRQVFSFYYLDYCSLIRTKTEENNKRAVQTGKVRQSKVRHWH